MLLRLLLFAFGVSNAARISNANEIRYVDEIVKIGTIVSPNITIESANGTVWFDIYGGKYKNHFKIDGNGTITTTRELVYKENHDFYLKIAMMDRVGVVDMQTIVVRMRCPLGNTCDVHGRLTPSIVFRDGVCINGKHQVVIREGVPFVSEEVFSLNATIPNLTFTWMEEGKHANDFPIELGEDGRIKTQSDFSHRILDRVGHFWLRYKVIGASRWLQECRISVIIVKDRYVQSGAEMNTVVYPQLRVYRENQQGSFGFEILSNDDQPFAIDGNGVLRTTKVLHYRDRQEYNVTIKMVQSDTVFATQVIRIKVSCPAGYRCDGPTMHRLGTFESSVCENGAHQLVIPSESRFESTESFLLNANFPNIHPVLSSWQGDTTNVELLPNGKIGFSNTSATGSGNVTLRFMNGEREYASCTINVVVNQTRALIKVINEHPVRNISSSVEVDTIVGPKLVVQGVTNDESLHFEIIGGNNEGAFRIDDNGILRTRKMLDYKLVPLYTLTIIVQSNEKTSVCDIDIVVNCQDGVDCEDDELQSTAFKNSICSTGYYALSVLQAEEYSSGVSFNLSNPALISRMKLTRLGYPTSFPFNLDSQGRIAFHHGNESSIADLEHLIISHYMDEEDSPILSCNITVLVGKDRTIDDYAPIGSEVLPALKVFDQDANDTHTFRIVGTNPFFKIDNQGILSTQQQIDFFKDAYHNLTIEVMDSSGLNHQRNIIVRVLCPKGYACDNKNATRLANFQTGVCFNNSQSLAFNADRGDAYTTSENFNLHPQPSNFLRELQWDNRTVQIQEEISGAITFFNLNELEFSTMIEVILNYRAMGSNRTYATCNIAVEFNKSINIEPPPALETVRFNDIGTSIEVTFDKPVGRANFPKFSFQCDRIINMLNASSFGNEPKCFWGQEDKLLRIDLGEAATIKPGDVLVIRGGVIYANEFSEFAMTEQSFTILPPANPILPVAIVSGARSLGQCDDLYLDVSASTGGGGRALEIQWTMLNFKSSNDSSSTSIFEELLQNATKNNKVELYILGEDILPNYTYEIFVLVKNFLGANGTSESIIISKKDLPLPSIKIVGPAVRTILRSDPISLVAVGSSASCGNETKRQRLLYTWSLKDQSLDLSGIVKSTNLRKLDIPSLVFLPGTKYKVVIQVAMADRPTLFNSAIVVVDVKPSPLISVISGGNRTSGSGESLKLDASSSIDPDVQGKVFNLKYSWTCAKLNDTTGDACLNTREELIVLPSQSNFTLPKFTFPENGAYKFSVIVSKDDRTAMDFVVLRILEGIPPKVFIEPLLASKVNANKKTVLIGSASSSVSKVSTSWEMVKGHTGAQQSKIFAVPIGRSTMSLKPNSLLPGKSYEFRLVATDAAGAVGSATIAITINLPPTSGRLLVEPNSGTELETQFKLQSQNWVDEDLPLQFAFKYSIAKNAEILLGDFSQSTTLLTSLPSGNKNNGSMYITSYVADSIGATSSTEVQVVVTPPVISKENLNAYVKNRTNDNLGTALDEGNKEKVLQLVTILGGMLDEKDSTSDTVEEDSNTSPNDETSKIKACAFSNGVECGGHGTCLRSIVNCLATDADCDVNCKCESKWYGTSCEIDEEKHMEKQEMLATLLDVLSNATLDNDDASSETLEQQANSIATLTKSSDTFNADDSNKAITIVDNIVNAALAKPDSKTISKASGDAVGNALSELLESTAVGIDDAANATTVDDDSSSAESSRQASTKIAKSVRGLSIALLASTNPGEPPITFASKNIKFSVQRDDPSYLDGKAIELPLSADQEKLGYKKMNFNLPNTFSSSSSVVSGRRLNSAQPDDPPCLVDTRATVYGKNIHGSSGNQVNSPVLSLELECNGGKMEVKNLTEPIRFNMRNKRKIPLANATKPLILTKICDARVRNTIVFDCEENGLHDVYCNGTKEYTVNFVCPKLEYASKCQFWDVNTNQWSSEGCSTVDITEEYTICECDHLTDFSSEVEENLSAVLQEFTEVLGSINKITFEDLQANFLIVFSISMLYLVFIMGCVLSNRWDKRDRERMKQYREKRIQFVEEVKITSLFEASAFAGATNLWQKFVVLLKRSWQGIRENHKLLSIVFKYDERYTRPQRLMVVITVTMSHMFSNALLYTMRQGETTIATMVVSGIISSICLMPIAIIMAILFKKAAKTEEYILRYQYEDFEGQQKDIEVDAYGQAYEYGTVDVLKMELYKIAQDISAEAALELCEDLNFETLSERLGMILRGLYVIVRNIKSSDFEDERTTKDLINVASIELDRDLADSLLEDLVSMLATNDGENFILTLREMDPIYLSPALFTSLEKLAATAKDCDGEYENSNVEVFYEYFSKFLYCSSTYRSSAVDLAKQTKRELEYAKLQLLDAKAELKSQLEEGIDEVVTDAQKKIIADLGGSANKKVVNKKAKKIAKKEAQVLKKKHGQEKKETTLKLKSEISENKKKLNALSKSAKVEEKTKAKDIARELEMVTQNLHGLAKLRKRMKLKSELVKQQKIHRLPLHEREAYALQEEKLKELKFSARFMYNRFLRRKPQLLKKPLFPDWINYVIYFICIAICAWSGFYVVIFAMRIEKADSALWIGSLYVGLMMTYLVSDPMKIFLKKGVLPLVATSVVAGTGILEVGTKKGARDGDDSALQVMGATGTAKLGQSSITAKGTTGKVGKNSVVPYGNEGSKEVAWN